MKRGAVAKAYRGLLRAVNKHLGEDDAKRRFREYVNQEFQSNSALMDPLDVRRKVMLAKDYTFLLNSVHHHKELLLSEDPLRAWGLDFPMCINPNCWKIDFAFSNSGYAMFSHQMVKCFHSSCSWFDLITEKQSPLFLQDSPIFPLY